MVVNTKLISVKFDGEKLQTPAELKDQPPGEYFLLLPRNESSTHSWRDVVKQSKVHRSEREISGWLQELRSEWDE
jgi:hypothetical protein